MNSTLSSPLWVWIAPGLGVVLLGAGPSALAHRAQLVEPFPANQNNATVQPAAERAVALPDFSMMEKRIRQIQPLAKERRFDEIGWAKDIGEAERLAKESNRPVFL